MHASVGLELPAQDLPFSVSPIGSLPVPGSAVAFMGISGFLHPAGGPVGVVLCSPWGFEELSMRKGWRLLAEAIAGAGYPCLRFDYPGTGNSLGATADIASIAEWVGSVHRAAEFLRVRTGVRRFVFLGQSLGATLAVTAARARSDVVGLQLIAPVVKGRTYARELAATGALVAQRLGVSHKASAVEALNVVGFPLTRSLVDSLKALEIARLDRLGGFEATIFDQSDRKAGVELLEQLRTAGANAHLETVDPYHLMISDAVTIQPLPVAPERVVAALRRAHPMVAPALAPKPVSRSIPMAAGATLADVGFCEEALRFGTEGSLFGVLCQPSRPLAGAPAVVLLNRGLNAHVGWRRVSVDHARALARTGIASLRIDVAGIGESRDEAGRPGNLIYSDLLLPDIRAAVDVLQRRGHGRIALAGVCSGAYAALLAARSDDRITDVFAVNPQRLVWNPAEDPEELVRYGLRSVNDYVGDLRGGLAWRKLIRSRRRVWPAARFLLRRYVRNAAALVPLALRSALLPRSMAARVSSAFNTLAASGTRVALVFSAGDPGLDELRQFFGPAGRDLRHPGASVVVIPGADHNLTTTTASDLMLAQLLRFCGADGPGEAAPAAELARPSGGQPAACAS